MNKTRVHKLPLKAAFPLQKHETAVSLMFKPSSSWFKTGLNH